MNKLTGVHESVLYGGDVPALIRFYCDVIGLRPVARPDPASVALRLPQGDAVLLLFDPDHTDKPGRGVPTHGGRGPGHIAFRVAPGTLPDWLAAFDRHGIAIELDRDWSLGGRSVYVRDPAGNSVELVDGAIWPS